MMLRFICILLCILSLSSLCGQERRVSDSLFIKSADSLYREDQFYFGFTFNLLLNKPSGIDQSGLSGGLHIGFIRDMPINKRRNVAIGLGIGYSFNSYGQNLFIGEREGTEESIFSNLRGVAYDRNRFYTHIIEAPLELRWRTSTPQDHRFYRIYTGFKLGYIYYFNSVFVDGSNTIKQTQLDELERLRMSLTLSLGWNTVNFYFHYGINPLFNDNATLESGEAVGLNAFKIGLLFYIL
ncbi:porin family protein [Aquimarina brevivitae]|uniref:Outer membrane protein with beta-barrel domain n=1 Tax=Aquimarina brevivitae TaxID=323412 RepID=A0A4Q7PER7_9FLAO|nr:porin family protein [Aquimarina brevivitae]RZS98926.1 outer membrane protein with beta-barrel domain [Aquimarina brevivitae]